MPHASIEWVLEQNCHRLVCLVLRVDAAHAVTVYFNGIPVTCGQCRTDDELQTFVSRTQADWQALGWRQVAVPSSLIRLVSTAPGSVTPTPPTVMSND